MALKFPPDENADVLTQLQRGGDELSLPRDIDFSVIFDSEMDAIAFADLVASSAMRAELGRADLVPGLPRDATVTRNLVPDHGAIGSFEATSARHASPLAVAMTDGAASHGEGRMDVALNPPAIGRNRPQADGHQVQPWSTGKGQLRSATNTC